MKKSNSQFIILVALLLIGFALLALIAYTGLGSSTDEVDVVDSTESIVKTATLLSPQEFNSYISTTEDVVVIDVHTPQQEHISDTDLLIPENQISTSTLLPKDKTTPIAVYCRSGSMSGRSAQELVDMGYTNVVDLEGGKNAWDSYYNQ